MQQAATAQRAQGPLVWLDMDQRALDDAYDQLVYAPNRDQVHERNVFNSERVRARLGEPKRIAYGPTEVEKFDLFTANKPNAPINVFIHGGAWRQRWAKDYAFLAEMFVNAGAHIALLDFVGVDVTKGDLMPMADQVRRAVAYIYKNAKSLGADPDKLYVSGHSSGAHLTGCVVTTDWHDYGVPQNLIKGALTCSGMYDLKPVRMSKRSEYVTFTDEVEEKLSSQRRLDRLNCPLLVGYGTFETPEFQRQAREFAAAVKAAGKPVTLLEGQGYNHFEMCEMIGNPLSLIGDAVLKQMKLV
ncbi:MAG: alpha/beta hydrolase [Alphaproteobacteria bacterium]|nr:alpha/beta hydrolase [Alphaproteobacteria bacterium]